jgi:type IV secretion system protein VirB9
MIRVQMLVALAIFSWAGAARAMEIPRPGPADSRIQSVLYDPDQVVQLNGTLGYQFMLEFDPDEKIETVSIGDALAWQVTPNRKANVLFLKPALGSTTNLTVLTDARRYAFELRVVPKRAGVPILYIARMIYPQPAQAVMVQTPAVPEAPPVVANYYYTMTGAKAERPAHIFDDGQKTYFQWTGDGALPAIFAVSADGEESLVNYVLHGPYVVVDQIAPAFVLRDGDDVTKVTNQGLKHPLARAATP